LSTCADYALGHSKRELARLEKQASFYADFTRTVLLKAGLCPGMRVLDVGCGVGDVAMEAARLVGAAGEVVGADRSDAALEAARARAADAGLTQARFERMDLHDLSSLGDFDAVVGRFILLHVRTPRETFRTVTDRLKPGGAAAFIEMDLTSVQVTPESPVFTQAVGWIQEAYRRDGVEPDMGSRLFSIFDAAGLQPTMEAVLRVEGGPDAEVYDYLAETVRSLLPRIVALDVATEAQVDIDTLAARARQASLLGKHCFFYPRMVGAWARRPERE